MTLRSLRISLAAGAAAIAATAASATTFSAESFENMIQNAAACVVGDVTNVEYVETEAGVVTRTTFNVVKSAFGPGGGEITVVTPGGRLSNTKYPMTRTIAGAPSFIAGQRHVLVLSDGPDDAYTVSGLARGVLPVVQTPEGEIVRLPFADAGPASLETALELIRERRDAPSEAAPSELE